MKCQNPNLTFGWLTDKNDVMTFSKKKQRDPFAVKNGMPLDPSRRFYLSTFKTKENFQGNGSILLKRRHEINLSKN